MNEPTTITETARNDHGIITLNVGSIDTCETGHLFIRIGGATVSLDTYRDPMEVAQLFADFLTDAEATR